MSRDVFSLGNGHYIGHESNDLCYAGALISYFPVQTMSTGPRLCLSLTWMAGDCRLVTPICSRSMGWQNPERQDQTVARYKQMQMQMQNRKNIISIRL